MITSRLNWEISTTETAFKWIAKFIKTDHVIIARTKTELMSKINKFEKEPEIWRMR